MLGRYNPAIRQETKQINETDIRNVGIFRIIRKEFGNNDNFIVCMFVSI